MSETINRNDGLKRAEVLSAIEAAGSVLLFCHLSPDGDTLGSAMALRLRLEAMGKAARIFVDGNLPSNMGFLAGMGMIEPPPREPVQADLALAVDVSCAERLGACGPAFFATARTALIDHHASNPGFAQVNWIDGDAPAAAALVFRLFEAMGGPVTRDEAICLYAALSTDTGNFLYESTGAESFRIMAALMDAGLPLAEYGRRLFREKEVPFVRLLGEALPSLCLTCGGKVAGLTLTAEQMHSALAFAHHAEGVVDYAIDLVGVKLAYFAREMDDGHIKVSLRARSPYRVDEVAALFGGGGHRLASGLTVDGDLDEVAQAVEEALAHELGSGMR